MNIVSKVMEKSWKFVGKNVYEPCIYIYIYIYVCVYVSVCVCVQMCSFPYLLIHFICLYFPVIIG